MKDNIKELLEMLYPSNYKISKDTGIAQTTLSDYASGKSDIGNMKLDHALKLNDYYKNIKEVTGMEMKTWARDTYTIEMVEYDHDLKAFEVTQNGEVQTIYPASLEDMESIIEDLDNGEDVDGWEDGLGNPIVIK